MKLERVSLAQFRAFDQIDLEFEKDVTVIAGINGIGKSAILCAIAKAISMTMPRVTLSNEKPIGLLDTDVKWGKELVNVTVALRTPNADIHVLLSRPRAVTREIASELTARRDELRFKRRATEKKSKDANDIDEELRRIEMRLKPVEDLSTVKVLPKDSENNIDDTIKTFKAEPCQPLAVFYPTSRLLSKLTTVTWQKNERFDFDTAYRNALDQAEVSLNDFGKWYRFMTEEGAPKKAARIFEQLETAISIFLPVNELTLHEGTPPKFSVKKNGSTLFLEQLSDGERGILALVFDLTRRLATANPDSDNAIAEGTAIVMIDEIELHLHPKWQRQVVRKLQEVFKNCQFIITTHSPQVIGQVKAEKLRLLSHDESGKVVLNPATQSFGMDSSWVLQNIMGVPARDYATEQRLLKIYDEIDAGKYEDARTLTDELRAEIGDFPDLQEAIALLDRFKMLGQG